MKKIIKYKIKLYHELLNIPVIQLTDNEIELMSLLANDNDIQEIFNKKV